MENLLAINQINNNSVLKQNVTNCNEYTSQFGIVLSQKDVLVLLDERLMILREQERLEFGSGILEQLIFAFCDSPYIYQDNYLDTIGRLQMIFYQYKNNSMDLWTDDELLELMVKGFNGASKGDLDYLEDTYLDTMARRVRGGCDE